MMTTLCKRLLPVSFFVLFAWLFVGCDSPQSLSDQQPQEKPQRYQLRLGHDMPEQSPLHTAAVRFADIVDYKSQGLVNIDIYPDQQLGTDHEMLAMARRGELAVILPPTAKMTGLVPAMQVLDLPFLFNSRQDVYDILDGPPGHALLAELDEFDLLGAAFWESGFKQFTANTPIRTPADFMGLNIRVMKSPIIAKQFKTYGANPVPVDFHKTYQALEDGVVDGQENPLASIVNMKFHQIQSHLTLSNHAYLAQALVFSRKIFNTLPKDVQEILFDTAREITSFERKEIIENEKRLLKSIKATGTKVHMLTSQEILSFKEASRPLIDGYTDEGRDILDMIDAAIRRRDRARENEIIIGLNADMVAGSALSGQAIQRGMALAVTEINDEGGVLGRKLKIMARDNSGISARGVDNIAEFAATPNLVAVMCGIYSPVALAVLERIHQEKIIMLDPWAAATKIVDNGYQPNYVFRASVRDAYAGPFLVEEALKKTSRVALLLVDDGWGRSNEKSMTRALNLQGKEPAAVEWFSWGEQDMTPKLDRIEASGAEIILMAAGAVEGATIIKNMASRSKKPPIISHWGITGGHFWKNTARQLEQVSLTFLQSFSFYNTATPQASELLKKYSQKYGISTPGQVFSPVGTAHAYDLVHLLALAIEKAGTIHRPAVRGALEQIKEYRGVVKHYQPPFTPERHDALDSSSYFLARYDSNGYIVPVAAQILNQNREAHKE